MAGYQEERNDLMEQLSNTREPQARRVVKEKIQRLDMANSEAKTKELDDALNYPLRKTRELVSGDENTWGFPNMEAPVHPGRIAMERANPDMEAIRDLGTQDLKPVAEFAADMVGDPANYLGAGLLSKVGKGTKAIPGMIASLENYIPNWYTTPEGLADLAQKGSDLAGWAYRGAQNVLGHAWSPTSRAAFREQNITAPAQNTVRRYLNNQGADTRAVPKGASQVQYTSGHIPQQTNTAVPNRPQAVQEVLDESFIREYQTYDPEKVAKDLTEIQPLQYERVGNSTSRTPSKAEAAAGTRIDISQDDADTFMDLVTTMQKPEEGAQIVIKNPTNINTGGHYSDVVHNSPAKPAIKAGFAKHMDADGNVNPKELGEWLQKNEEKFNEKASGSWRVEKVTEDGVWLRGGKVGSAITEGGVAWTMKIEPDGTLKVMMQDTHDFFEKIPGVKKLTPTGVLAISPVMVGNIKQMTKGITAPVRDAAGNILKEGRKHVKKTHTVPYRIQQAQVAPAPQTMPGMLSDYVNTPLAKPTPMDYVDAGRDMLGSGMLSLGNISRGREDR